MATESLMRSRSFLGFRNNTPTHSRIDSNLTRDIKVLVHSYYFPATITCPMPQYQSCCGNGPTKAGCSETFGNSRPLDATKSENRACSQTKDWRLAIERVTQKCPALTLPPDGCCRLNSANHGTEPRRNGGVFAINTATTTACFLHLDRLNNRHSA